MMKTSHFLSLLLSLCFVQVSLANTIYLEYDPACMDRYEYRYQGVKSGFSHSVYHLRLNDREKIILEVGVESKMDYESRPLNTKKCSSISLNERTVRDINNGDLQLFIVKRHSKGFNVSPVGIATYAQISDRGVGYSSIDNIFAYDYNQPANGANIAKRDSEAKVFFNGILSHTCPKKYLFTKTKQRAGRNYSEMTIIPEIGVVEEKTGFNQTDAANNVLELVSVNNVPIESYMNQFCRAKSRPGSANRFFSNRRGNVKTTPSTSSGGKSNSLATLEGGSKSNGKTLPGTTITEVPDEITATNTTTSVSTSSFNCPVYKDLDRQLYIDKNTGQPANLECGGNTYRNGRMVDSGGTVVTTPPTTPDPTPSTPGATKGNTSGTNPSGCPEVSTYGFHVVQPNETLYGISRLYGVKVSDLRGWNDLRSTDLIHPCMKLQTRSDASPTVTTVSNSNTGFNDENLSAKDGSVYMHTVKPGETIFQLAKQYGYTVEKFKEINGLESNMISVGQKLRTSDCNCPADGNNSAPAPDATTAVASTDIPLAYEANEGRIVTTDSQKRKIHIVQESETIYNIAKKYDISVAKLRQLNNLEVNEVIIPFQRLYVN